MELIYLFGGLAIQFLILVILHKMIKKSNAMVVMGESVQTTSEYKTIWFDIKEHKPMHMMVLAAIDSSDCGWVADYVYWNDQEQCWYKSSDGEADMFYTHWTYLNHLTYPNGEEMYSKTPFPLPHTLIIENED